MAAYRVKHVIGKHPITIPAGGPLPKMGPVVVDSLD
jgi:hypothetical protein